MGTNKTISEREILNLAGDVVQFVKQRTTDILTARRILKIADSAFGQGTITLEESSDSTLQDRREPSLAGHESP